MEDRKHQACQPEWEHLVSTANGGNLQGLSEIRDLEDCEPTEYKKAWKN